MIEESNPMLNVLCLEDDFKDAELLNENLADGGYVVTMVIAKSKQEFADFLNRCDYDIIIADNSLPQFDALAALKMSLSIKPEIPFICLSGTIGEEKAIDLLKQGASDCVIKGRLQRLIFAVRRALKDNELRIDRKQNEKLLKESEERFHLLFDKAPLGYQSLDIGGNLIEVNQQWLGTLGYTKDEVVGKWFGDFLAPEYQDTFRKRFPIFKAEGKIHSEFEMLHKNGSRLFMAFDGRIGYGTNGEFKQTHCILQDITEVKKAQGEIVRQKEMLQKVIAHLPVMITYFDNNGNILLTNNEFEKVLGWTPEEWETENILAKCCPEPENLNEIYDFISSRNIGWKDFKTMTKYGTIIDTSWTIVSLSDGLSLAIGQDITKRKLEEELLKKSQLLLKSSIDSQQDTILFSIDKNYNYLFCNKGHSDAMKFAWNIDVNPDMNILDCIPNVDERLMAKKNYDRALNGESFTIIQKYGNVNPAYYESFFNPICDDKNEIIGCTGLARNITQRLLDEEELRNSYIFSDTLLKTIPFGMHIIDETGNVLFQSDNIKKMFGENVIGRKCWDLYRDDKKQCSDCPLFKGIILGETETYESNGVLGGRVFEISHTGMLYQGKKAMLEIFQDITERKLADEKLQKNESYLKETQIIANIGTYSMDITSGSWVSSEVLDKIFGIDTNYEKSVEAWTLILHPEWRESMIDYFNNEVISNKSKFDKEYKIIRLNDKTERWVHGIGNLKFDENDQPIAMIGTIQDITERKLNELEIIRTKEKVEESEVKFRNLFELSPLGMSITEMDGSRYVNNSFCKMVGYSKEELQSKKMLDISHPDDVSNTSEIIQALLDGKTEQAFFEKRYIHKKGKIVWVDKSTYLQRDKDGLPRFFVSTIIDSTSRKHYEEELIFAKEKAEESERLKTAFLANMSHEIRTPMNGIIGFTELLKEPNLTVEEQKDYIQTIQISGARMLNTINNIIDISKIESGLTHIDIQKTNINDKIDFAYKFFIQDSKSKGLQFSVKKGLSDENANIKTDNEKVYGVLTNLIKNAIKFTYDGSIEIGYEKRGEYLEFYVKDTGVGIPKKNQQIIFERFRQGSEFLLNRSFEGSGLGLSISKSYIEMLGGNLWVDSEEGIGSTFYFTIPYSTVSEEKVRKKEEFIKERPYTELRKLKTLIVEDDEISYSLLVRYVQRFSSEVIHALNGIQAIEACRNTPDLDLILMDVRMPIMNGLEATQQIRQFNTDVIIIAQTAYGFSSDCEKALEAGCNDYTTKPINRNLLFELIKKHVNK